MELDLPSDLACHRFVFRELVRLGLRELARLVVQELAKLVVRELARLVVRDVAILVVRDGTRPAIGFSQICLQRVSQTWCQ